MINGFHTIFYSDDVDATRAFFRDVLGWPWLDAHGGWLLFKSPPSEVGVHPTSPDQQDGGSTVPFHQASLMCDDINATIEELRAKGVEVDGPPKDQGWGLVTSIQVPGAGWLMLYQPRHPPAYELDG